MELHVWGPAFGLPSIDPECLAAIAYFRCIPDPELNPTDPKSSAWWIVPSSNPLLSPTRMFFLHKVLLTYTRTHFASTQYLITGLCYLFLFYPCNQQQEANVVGLYGGGEWGGENRLPQMTGYFKIL